jgi:hypothetical protein
VLGGRQLSSPSSATQSRIHAQPHHTQAFRRESTRMAESSVKVGVRLRPLLAHERGEAGESIISTCTTTQVRIKEKVFTFDYMFPSNVSQAGTAHIHHPHIAVECTICAFYLIPSLALCAL